MITFKLFIACWQWQYKRNGIAVEELGIEEYQQLLPIPQQEIYNGLTHNPGYKR